MKADENSAPPMKKHIYIEWFEPLLLALKAGIYEHAVPLDKNTYHSESWAAVLGYRKDELPPYEVFIEWIYAQVHLEDRELIENAYNDFVQGKAATYDVEIRIRHKKGHWIWVRGVSNALERAPDGRVLRVIGLIFDITKPKEAEKELRESEAALKIVLETLPAGVVIADAEGRIVRFNEAAKELWGIPPETVSWQDYQNFVAWWPKTGKRIQAHEWAMTRALVRGEETRNELVQNQRFNSSERRYYLNNVAPLWNADGQIIGGVAAMLDVTALQQVEEALKQSNKELTEYAYALTHNLKSPLRAIHNYVNFLFEDLADTLKGEQKKYLEGLRVAITQSNKQFEDLETLYRINNHQMYFETFEMKQLLDEIQFLFKDTPEKELIVAQNWPVFRSERLLLRQILIALINNGFKFNRADIRRVKVGLQTAADNRIEIFVRDNGIGIDPQYQQQIFDIFRRLHTESEYEGTGIGLAIVKRAVQKIGGKLRIQSAVGEGSTFYINLPDSILENYHV